MLKVVNSRQVNAIVAGHEEVRSPSPTCFAANENQSCPGFGIFKRRDKDVLPLLNISLNTNLSLT